MKYKSFYAVLTGVIIMLFSHVFAPARHVPDPIGVNRIEASPHYRDGKFISGGASLDMPLGDMVSSTWTYLFGENSRTPAKLPPTMPVALRHFNRPGNNQLSATWLGHSSLMINIDGYKILVDPVFQTRISVVGPSRFNGDVPLDVRQLSRIDAVIISHDHYDHLNKASIVQLREKTDRFIVPLAVGARLEAWGVPRDNITELDWWEEYVIEEKLTIAATPAQHFSGRGLFDRNETLWASWVIMAPWHRIFFSGDSGYFDGFKQIGDKYGPFDMTFVECGAYDAAWRTVHMFPEETVQAHMDLRGNILHPIHWGTFNLALHAWYDPMRRLTRAASAAGISVATPVVGQSTVYPSGIPNRQWWEEVAG